MKQYRNLKKQELFQHSDSPELLQRFWLKCTAKCAWPFYPWLIEETRRRQATTYQERFCRYAVLVVMLDGELFYQCENHSYRLAQGDMLLIPPGGSYGFDSRPSCFYHKLVVEYRGCNLLSVLDTMRLQQVYHYSASKKNDEILKKIRNCTSLIEHNQHQNMSEILGLSYSILADCATMTQPKAPPRGNLAKLQMRLENQLDEPLTMKELAAELKCSVMQMTREFQKRFHVTPKAYRDICRMEHALNLLQDPSLSIKEIAYQVGCRDQFQFSRQFRAYQGCSPLQYRKSQRKPAPGKVQKVRTPLPGNGCAAPEKLGISMSCTTNTEHCL